MLHLPDDRLLGSNIEIVEFLMNLSGLLMTFTTCNRSALSKEIDLNRRYRWQISSIARESASYLSLR